MTARALTLLFVPCASLLFSSCSSCRQDRPVPVPKTEQQLAQAAVPAAGPSELAGNQNQFAVTLFAKLTQGKGNIFFSPSSVATALAMTYAGARGNTEQQIAKVLHLQDGQSSVHSSYAQFLETLNREGKENHFKLAIANRLWGQRTFSFLKSFLDLTRDRYGAELETLDFSQPEPARQKINQWVEQKTENKIRDLIKPGILNSRTRLILTNAIYFKGDWQNKFDPKKTHEAPFHLVSPEGKAAQISSQLMEQTSKFKYGEAGNLQVLELPYAAGMLSMIIVLPRELNGIAALEKQLSYEHLQSWIELATSNRREREVHVFLPKVKMSTQFQLAQTLASMGMPDAFSMTAADFSGMDGQKDLFITHVVHQAFVDIYEEGTEAAAATGIVMGLKSMPMSSPPVFRADHPFLFLIRHNSSGAILFMGRVASPS